MSQEFCPREGCPSMQWVLVVSASGSKECTTPWADTPRDGHWSGWYASYWNAFLLCKYAISQSVTLSKTSLTHTTLEINESIWGLVLPLDPPGVCYLGKHFAMSFSPLIHPLNSNQTYQNKFKLRIYCPSPPVVRWLFLIHVFLVFTAGHLDQPSHQCEGELSLSLSLSWYILLELRAGN